jgi:serine/threonine protein kinase
VQRLLAHDDRPQFSLRSPVDGVARELREADFAEPPALSVLPDRIGSYRILSQIGEGGFGVVYMAEQPHPRRTVAIKVLRAALASPSTLRRFAFEVEILGRLRHAGIAQVYEAGFEDRGP